MISVVQVVAILATSDYDKSLSTNPPQILAKIIASVMRMKWVSRLSTKVSLEAALQELADQVLAVMSADCLDLGFLFVSNAFASDYPRLLPLLHDKLPIKQLVGCSGGGIIGGGQELGETPAIALMVGHIPDGQFKVFHVQEGELPDLDAGPQPWQDMTGVAADLEPSFVLLGDPFSFRVNDLLQGMDFAYGRSIKVGGLASSGGLGSNAMFAVYEPGKYRLHRNGLLGLALWGDVMIDTVVAQGCRPIGPTLQVSECDRNLILGLDGKRPLSLLQDIVNELSESDRELAQSSLFVGMVMNEFKANPTQGDFLIRNIIGVDPRSGAIAIGDRLRPGQRLQLHLRDAAASATDLAAVLERYDQHLNQNPTDHQPEAALLFSCLGRGERLYNQPDFDSQMFIDKIGDLPISGFFCSGEIGPVGGTTFLHGYTSVFGIVRQRSNVVANYGTMPLENYKQPNFQADLGDEDHD